MKVRVQTQSKHIGEAGGRVEEATGVRTRRRGGSITRVAHASLRFVNPAVMNEHLTPLDGWRRSGRREGHRLHKKAGSEKSVVFGTSLLNI